MAQSQETLRSGLNDGEDNYYGNQKYGFMLSPLDQLENYFPASKQKAIEKLNTGKDVDYLIKRNDGKSVQVGTKSKTPTNNTKTSEKKEKDKKSDYDIQDGDGF